MILIQTLDGRQVQSALENIGWISSSFGSQLEAGQELNTKG
jgi:hypothetical protein